MTEHQDAFEEMKAHDPVDMRALPSADDPGAQRLLESILESPRTPLPMPRRRRLVVVVAIVVLAFLLVAAAAWIMESVVLTGVNQTGRTDLSHEDWMDVARRGCSEGAWDWDVSQEISDEVLGSNVPEGAATVWLVTVQLCHDDVPEDALLRGPPPP